MKKIFLYIILSLFLHKFQAQTNPLDLEYTPNENSIFNTNPKLNKGVGENNGNIRNLILYKPNFLFRQKVVFAYERHLTNSIALSLSAGKAFGADVFQEAHLEVFSAFDVAEDFLSSGNILSNTSYYGSTPFLSAAIKIYVEETAFDGSYIEISYTNERLIYALDESFVIDRRYRSKDKSIKFKMNEFVFNYGYSSLFGPNKKISHSFYFGLGAKFFKYDKIAQKIDTTPAFNGQPYYVKETGSLSARVLPSVHIGYALGFGF